MMRGHNTKDKYFMICRTKFALSAVYCASAEKTASLCVDANLRIVGLRFFFFVARSSKLAEKREYSLVVKTDVSGEIQSIKLTQELTEMRGRNPCQETLALNARFTFQIYNRKRSFKSSHAFTFATD